MRRPTLASIGLALVAAGACDPGAARAPMAIGGLGAAGEFAALAEGQEVEAVAGAQGGFHVWVKVRVEGQAGAFRLERTARRVLDEALVLRSSGELALDGARFESEPLPMFLCPSPVGIAVVDQAIRFALLLTDEDGSERARGEITLVPRCPPDESGQRDLCRRICSG